MLKVSKVIQEKCHWGSHGIPIFLYLNNAGGHRTKSVVDTYVKALKGDWNNLALRILISWTWSFGGLSKIYTGR